jgi:hypothetical protein
MGLAIKIDANTVELHKSIDQAKSDLTAFKAQLEKATDTATITKLNKSIKETQDFLKGVKNIGFDSQEIKTGSAQAATALTNLGRVASDAPFGFIAIQNNLDPLIQSFGYLKNETGSTKAAFQALAGSLAGPAGVGLAFSVISSLVTTLIQKYGSLGEAMAVLTTDTSAAAEANREMAQSFAVAEGKAAGEVAEIRALLTVARDQTLSRDAQNEAIKKLNSEYDKFLPKLTQENIDTKGVTDAVDKLTESLVRQAKIKGLQDLISKETQKQAEAMTKSLGGQATAWDNIIAVIKSARPGGNFFDEQTIQGAGTAAKTFKDAQTAIDLFIKELIGLNAEEAKAGTLFGETATKVDLLAKRIEALKQLQSTTGLDLAQKIELTSLQAQITKRDQIKLGLKPAEVKERIQFLINETFPQEFLNFRVRGVLQVEPQATKIQNPEDLTKNLVNDIQRATGTFYIEPKQIVVNPPKNIKFDPFAEALGQAFTDSLSLIGEEIGKALDTGDFFGGLKAAINGIFSILGDTLMNIGKQLIATSVLVKALKSALNGLFGPGGEAVGLAVGIGLVAFGSVLKNMPKMADGGIVSSATIATVGEAGTEVVAPLSKLPYLMNQAGGGGGGGQVVGISIKGRELIAFLDREYSYAKRLR